MVCHTGTAGIVLGSLILPFLLAGPLLGLLHHKEKRERRKLNESADQTSILVPEQKTVTVENRGPIGGTAGVAEIVTTGPTGTTVSTVPTAASGAAIVSTATTGVPGSVSVDPGRTVVVTAEHPPGRPEEAVVTNTTHK